MSDQGLVLPQPAKVIRSKRCETCSAWEPPPVRIVQGKEQNGQCRAGLPEGQVIPVPGPNNNILPLTFSCWPPTSADQWCRDFWQPKEKALQ